MVLDHINSTPSDILRKVVKDMVTWSGRYNALKPHLTVWKDWLLTCF